MLPPASGPVESSPVSKVQPYFLQHKCDEVQTFDKNVQQLETITPEQFLEHLRGSDGDDLLPSEIPKLGGLTINNFCDLANGIAQSINARREHCLLCIYLFLTTP